jgi:hypothetical protein
MERRSLLSRYHYSRVALGAQLVRAVSSGSYYLLLFLYGGVQPDFWSTKRPGNDLTRSGPFLDGATANQGLAGGPPDVLRASI